MAYKGRSPANAPSKADIVVPGASGLRQRQAFGVAWIRPLTGSTSSLLAANTQTHCPIAPLDCSTEQLNRNA